LHVYGRAVVATTIVALVVGTLSSAEGTLGARGADPLSGGADRTTRILVGGKRVGSVTGGGFWEASWGEGWISRVNARLFEAGCESPSDKHRWAVAQRKTTTNWTVSAFPSFRRLGSLEFEQPRRWRIEGADARRTGFALGPHGVAAGLAWLGLRRCT
jgi:hypothetical protein